MATRTSGFFLRLFSSHQFKNSSSLVGLVSKNNQQNIQKLFTRKFVMASERPVETAVRTKLTEALKPDHLDVINESSMHNVPPESESHFKVVIVSQAFESLSRIKKHQLVHQAIQEEIDNCIHALSIIAKTPKEWEESQDVGKSPPCRGGSGL